MRGIKDGLAMPCRAAKHRKLVRAGCQGGYFGLTSCDTVPSINYPPWDARGVVGFTTVNTCNIYALLLVAAPVSLPTRSLGRPIR
jgi:hypothetical protein